MSVQLIVSADDYGICPEVNEAIEECLLAGTLRCTCIMVNMPFCDSARILRKSFLDRSIGLHWNLTQGNPILPVSKVPSLVDSDGNFYSKAKLRILLSTSRININELRNELIAQYNSAFELIGIPDFWNTHQNFHLWPGLFQLCIGLGKELGMKAMRSQQRITVPRQGTPMSYNLTHPTYWIKTIAIDRWFAWAKEQGMIMPDGLIYTPGFDNEMIPIDEISKSLNKWLENKTAEYLIHPATAVRHDLFGELLDNRVAEYRVFKDPDLIFRLSSQNINPVGFEVLF